jgi:hypothetical protein
MPPAKVYELFHALKLHFSSSTYDFHKFHGKIKPKLKEEDKNFWCYKKVGESFSDKDIFGLFLSNIIASSSPLYIRDFLKDSSRETFLFWKEKIDNKYDVLLLECKYIKKNFGISLKELLEEKEKILSLSYRNDLSLESLVLLLSTFTLGKNDKEDIIFDLLLNKINKYRSFIDIDCEKVKRIVELISF